MAKEILFAIKQPPTLLQRLRGTALVGTYLRGGSPSLTPEAVSCYYATLVANRPKPALAEVARALLWADLKNRQYHTLCAVWYVFAAEHYPDDEGCVFYVAALHQHGFLTMSTEELLWVSRSLLRREWLPSPSWSRLALSRTQWIESFLAALKTQPEGVVPADLQVLEGLFESATLSEELRPEVAAWLGAAYRTRGQSDEAAELIYRYLFVHKPDDRDNNRYLAQLFAGRNLDDSNACAVYRRMMELTSGGSAEAQGIWAVRLARAYIARNQLGPEAIAPLQIALASSPKDRLLEAALVYSIGRSEGIVLEPALLSHLERALAFEAELIPFFAERQWQWSVVSRALALAWGALQRFDSLAGFIYRRAVELCPEEKALWGYYAEALKEAQDHSLKAIGVYEKALLYQGGELGIQQALARAYYENQVYQGGERRKVLNLWEELARKKTLPPELFDGLIQIYQEEEHLSNTALEILNQRIDTGVGIPAVLLLQIAREWQRRAELPIALRWYRQAEQALPQHFPTLLEYGLLLKEKFSDFTGAISILARAVVLPEGVMHLKAHIALAESLLNLDRRDDARRVFQIIVERIEPGHVQSLLYLARLNLRFEEQGVQKAETLYERVAGIEPNNPVAYQNMIELYRAQGNTQMEQWALEKYLATGDPTPARFRELADLYIRQGEFEKAEAALRQVIVRGKADAKTYALLGDIVQQLRRKP